MPKSVVVVEGHCDHIESRPLSPRPRPALDVLNPISPGSIGKRISTAGEWWLLGKDIGARGPVLEDHSEATRND